MTAALLIILLASICLLHAGADTPNIPVHPDLDVQRLAGTWYSISFVLKNHEPADVISIDEVVEPSDAGDMLLKIRFIFDGACQESNVNMVHTDQPGVFTVPDTPEIVHMVDVDYESYHIMHVTNEDTYSLYLLSRTREAAGGVEKKFRKLAKTLGYKVKQITSTRLAGKSEFGGMFEECTTSIISIMVLQMTLPAICHIF